MAEDPDALARVVHETRCSFAAALDRPMTPAPWEQRHPRQQQLDREIAAKVEARVRADIAADFKRLAADLKPHPLVPPGVPGIERAARQDTWRAAAVVAVNGLSPEGRDNEKEAGRG